MEYYVGLVIAFIKEKVKMLVGLFGTRKHRLIGMDEVTLSLTCKGVFLVSELLAGVFLEVKHTL